MEPKKFGVPENASKAGTGQMHGMAFPFPLDFFRSTFGGQSMVQTRRIPPC